MFASPGVHVGKMMQLVNLVEMSRWLLALLFTHSVCNISLSSTSFVFVQQNHLRTAADMSSHGNAPTTFTQQQTWLHIAAHPSSHSNKCVFTQQHTHLYTATMTIQQTCLHTATHPSSHVFTPTRLYTATVTDRIQKCIKMIYSK